MTNDGASYHVATRRSGQGCAQVRSHVRATTSSRTARRLTRIVTSSEVLRRLRQRAQPVEAGQCLRAIPDGAGEKRAITVLHVHRHGPPIRRDRMRNCFVPYALGSFDRNFAGMCDEFPVAGYGR